MNSKINYLFVPLLSISLFSCAKRGGTNQVIYYEYYADTQTATVKECPNYDFETLIIPETIMVDDDQDGINEMECTVTNISINAFKNNKYIKEVVIPDTITNIGYDAFYQCKNLQKVTMSNRIEVLPDHLFTDCQQLTEFNGGENVNTLYKGVFAGTNIEELTFTKLEYLDIDCFWNNDNLKKVTLDGSFTTLPGSCFEKCVNLTEVSLPSSLNTIDNFAFKDCEKLNNLELNNLKNIGRRAFENCGFVNLNISNVENISYGAFSQCKNLATLTLENVKTVGSNAFSKCALETVTFDSKLENINSEAFSENKISKMNLEDCVNLTTISRKAFYDNQLMTELKIPSSVKYIYPYAFQKNNLSTVYVNINCSLSEYVFDEDVEVKIEDM